MSFPFVSHSTAGHNDVAEMINPYGNRRRGEKSGEAKAAIVYQLNAHEHSARFHQL